MYRDARFEWDEAKNCRNQVIHGLSFQDIRGAFDDDHSIEVEDDRHMEVRWKLIARIPLTDLVVVVAYTERGLRDRVISARVATPAEERTYYAHGD